MTLTALAVGLYLVDKGTDQVLPWLGFAALFLTILSALIWRVGSHIVASYHWMHTAARALTHGAAIDPQEAPSVEARQLGAAFEHAAANLADANAAYEEKAARLDNILDTAMDAIITSDEHGRILMFNRAAEQMMKLSRWEAIGLQLDTFIPPEARRGHLDKMRHFAEESAKPRRLAHGRVITAQRSDGETFLAEASISVATHNEQRLFTVIMRDVTMRERQLEALTRANEDLMDEVNRLTRVIEVFRSTKRGI